MCQVLMSLVYYVKRRASNCIRHNVLEAFNSTLVQHSISLRHDCRTRLERWADADHSCMYAWCHNMQAVGLVFSAMSLACFIVSSVYRQEIRRWFLTFSDTSMKTLVLLGQWEGALCALFMGALFVGGTSVLLLLPTKTTGISPSCKLRGTIMYAVAVMALQVQPGTIPTFDGRLVVYECPSHGACTDDRLYLTITSLARTC